MTYDPRTHRMPAFQDAVPAFLDGADTPRDFLERCFAAIETREADIGAFVVSDIGAARRAADEAAARYAAGAPLSPVDGLPLGVKDTIETADFPTQMGSPYFAGYQPRRNAACIDALKRGGAIIFGKTVSTEFAFGRQMGTRNPHDPACTPGTSSSGSAAAVGGGMLPAALGTQLKSSVTRPASYCGSYGFKPSWGALSMAGVHPFSPSGDHLGTHGGTLADCWTLARFISAQAGPEPGQQPLSGPFDLPNVVRPQRLAVLRTPGWDTTIDSTKSAFADFTGWLSNNGVEIVESDSNPVLAAVENDTRAADSCIDAVSAFEMRWLFRAYRDNGADLSARILSLLDQGEAMSIEDYQAALAWKAAFRAHIAAAGERVDGFIMPSSCGPAPVGLENFGDPVFGVPATCSGSPSFGLPLLSVRNMPQGVTVMGFRGQDDILAATARWICDHYLAGNPRQ